MKSSISLPIISFFTLTSTVTAAPQSTPTASASASSTGLSEQQMAAIRSYAQQQETKSAYISVSKIVKTAVPAATLAREQADFRLAALTTDAPKLPSYLGNINDAASSYLQDYYLAQASIINHNGANKAVETDGGANLLEGITESASGTSSKLSSTKKAEPKPTTISGATGSQTTEKPSSTGTKASDSTGTGTASSGTSTGAAAIAQPTGVMKMAGVGMLGVAGFAAFM